MHAPNENPTPSRSEQAAGPAHPPASNLVSIWARGRRQITPWAYAHLRAVAAARFIIGVFLVGLGALFLSRGYYGPAAAPLAVAALLLSIAYLDFTVARSAPHRL